MKLRFISNACNLYESDNKKILTDPWLTPGAFYGSWFHYPPLKTTPKDVADYDYLYISHLHPDHYDRETLKHFDKSKPAIIYDDEGPNYLERIMKADGFTNILKIKNKETIELGPFKLTMFGPFVKHPFYDCKVGNVIDSCLVVRDIKHTVINTNDNTPDLKSALMLKEMFPNIYIAQLNYNPAGPYPVCFSNLSWEEKLDRANFISSRQLDHLVAVAKILKPTYVQPFAGAYVLGGTKNFRNNAYLGTISQEKAKEEINKRAPNLEVLICNEASGVGDTFKPYKDTLSYIASLNDKTYSYEKRLPTTGRAELFDLVELARRKMFKAQDDFSYFEDFNFALKTYDMQDYYVMNLRTALVEKQDGLPPKPFIMAELDRTLLEDILFKKAHWNNAEIGCHIDFWREPDEYRVDFHTLMSFFHL